MDFNVQLHTRKGSYNASHAVLLYEDAYASVHEVVTEEDGNLRIEHGQPATVQGLRGLFEHLDPNRLLRPTLLEPRVLSQGPTWSVWYSKPTNRCVWFNDKRLGKRSAVVPHPGLIFAVVESKWSVFAVKTTRRPRGGTKLYQAPYFNVWESGQICTGSAQKPSSAGDLSGFERAFFESEFSHPNIHEPGRLTLAKGGAYKLWKGLLDGKYKRFPNDTLVPLGLSVQELIERLWRN